MKKSKKENKKILIEFDADHLPVLISALETYSRLQSGQVKIAIDEVYWDRNLTYEEGQFIENTVRCFAFPSNAKREYDGHGEFYDQYNNEYDERGTLIKESEDWQRKKTRPHLDHPNAYFGVGCKEMRAGTVAWEIKKAIEEYSHYERNDGYRNIMSVDGDGVLNISGISSAKIVDSETKEYWKPVKRFPIPLKFQTKIANSVLNKNWKGMWEIIDKAFNKKPLPKGSTVRIEEKDSMYYVIVEKPYK